jgi:hypothetical protein
MPRRRCGRLSRSAALLLRCSCLAALLRLAAAHVCAHDALPVHSGVAAGERHPQRYGSHPFASVFSAGGAAQASRDAGSPRGTARRLAQSAGNASAPYDGRQRSGLGALRVVLDWRGDGGNNASAAVLPLVQAWLRHALVPAAAAWWRAALQVRPARALQALGA